MTLSTMVSGPCSEWGEPYSEHHSTTTHEMFLVSQGILHLSEVFLSLVEPPFKGLLLLLISFLVPALSEELNFLVELLPT